MKIILLLSICTLLLAVGFIGCYYYYTKNPLYLIFDKINGYFEEINGNKCLALVPNNESK